VDATATIADGVAERVNHRRCQCRVLLGTTNHRVDLAVEELVLAGGEHLEVHVVGVGIAMEPARFAHSAILFRLLKQRSALHKVDHA
jgi:hypothetical protein